MTHLRRSPPPWLAAALLWLSPSLLGCHAVSGLGDFAIAGEGGGAGGGAAGGGGAGGSGASLVGNCALDGGETCDDCNDEPGDGCDALGAVEPGWHCPEVGEACVALSGFTTTSGELLTFGGDGGGDFAEPCPAGEFLIGFDGFDESVRVINLRAVCAAPTLGATGLPIWQQPGTVTPFHGGADMGTLGQRRCAPGSFVVGAVAFQNGVIEGIELLCAPLELDEASLVYGDVTALPILGDPNPDIMDPAQQCAAGSLIRGVSGRQGARVDRLELGCLALTPTFCGDGTQEGPEACEDGNAADGDGCSARCRVE